MEGFGFELYHTLVLLVTAIQISRAKSLVSDLLTDKEIPALIGRSSPHAFPSWPVIGLLDLRFTIGHEWMMLKDRHEHIHGSSRIQR